MENKTPADKKEAFISIVDARPIKESLVRYMVATDIFPGLNLDIAVDVEDYVRVELHDDGAHELLIDLDGIKQYIVSILNNMQTAIIVAMQTKGVSWEIIKNESVSNTTS